MTNQNDHQDIGSLVCVNMTVLFITVLNLTDTTVFFEVLTVSVEREEKYLQSSRVDLHLIPKTDF